MLMKILQFVFMSSICEAVICAFFLFSDVSGNFDLKSAQSGFFVGRISEGQFEYTDLNGWMTPRKAIEICEGDDKCGGFTYKVNDPCFSFQFILFQFRAPTSWTENLKYISFTFS